MKLRMHLLITNERVLQSTAVDNTIYRFGRNFMFRFVFKTYYASFSAVKSN